MTGLAWPLSAIAAVLAVRALAALGQRLTRHHNQQRKETVDA